MLSHETYNRIAKLKDSVDAMEAKGLISFKDYKALLEELIALVKIIDSELDENDSFANTWPGDDVTKI